MTTLPPPTQPTAILSFDFDGTLHDSASNPPVPVAFFELIRKLREEQGVVWGINTGRSMPQMVEGFIESRFPFLPDWVVAREREIYFPNDFGRWLPHAAWNKRCEKEIHGLFKHSAKLLLHIRHEVETPHRCPVDGNGRRTRRHHFPDRGGNGMDRRPHRAAHRRRAAPLLAAELDLPALRPPGFPERQQPEPGRRPLSACPPPAVSPSATATTTWKCSIPPTPA